MNPTNSPQTTVTLDEIEINGQKYILKSKAPTYTPRKEGPWEIGKRYMFRTVTMINTGLLVDVTPNEFVITQAAWIADTGRFSDFVAGTIIPNEVEPFPQDKIVIIGRGALVDAIELDKVFDKRK